MVGATKHRTQADQHRFDQMAELGCIPCAVQSCAWVVTERHHLKSGDRRRGHRFTVPICCWHHRAEPSFRCCKGKRETAAHHGPSLAESPREFRERYGTDDQLLQITDAVLRMMDRAEHRGEYIPPGNLGRLTRLLHRSIVLGKSPTLREIECAERVTA